MITITITGSASEVKKELQDLSNSLAINSEGQLLDSKTEKPTKINQESTSTEQTLTDSEEYTIEMVRAAAAEIAESGKRQEVKALISSFDGAKNINSLDKRYYKEFLEKLKEL